MNCYLEAKPHPWVTWDKDLWKISQNKKENSFSVVTNKSEADVCVYELHKEFENKEELEKKNFFYVESLDDVDNSILNTMKYKGSAILTDSMEVKELFSHNGFVVKEWNKPSRVSGKWLYKDCSELKNKTGGFVITSNGSRMADGFTEILRTYFAVCLKDDKQNEGMLECIQDVDIFSAYELPFETFNNVSFHGLRPNPVMFKAIKNSTLFVSPYNGDGIPINAIDSVMLGTPVLVRDTNANIETFGYDERCIFKDEKDLAIKLQYFADLDTGGKEYCDLVEKGFSVISRKFSQEVCLERLSYLL